MLPQDFLKTLHQTSECGAGSVAMLWRRSPPSAVGILMKIAAFLRPIVGIAIAVRRPARKREAAFAPVYTSIAIAPMIMRVGASFAGPGGTRRSPGATFRGTFVEHTFDSTAKLVSCLYEHFSERRR